MTLRPVILRALAVQDAERAVDHLLAEAGPKVADSFIGALQKAYGHIGEFPESGSPRYGHELGLPGVRSWTVHEFEYIVFYSARPDQVDVLRLLHGRQDIPALLQALG